MEDKMTLLDKIEELRVLEKKATPAKWELRGYKDFQIVADDWSSDFYINFEDSDIDDPKLIIELRNAAPDLLDVLGGFQKGDADHLELTIELIKRFTTGVMGWHEELAVLKRYADMARKMEQEEKR